MTSTTFETTKMLRPRSQGRIHAFSLSRADQRGLLILLGVLLLVRVLAMFWLPLMDTTEARYAEIARKMVETGDWITPQFDYGVPFWGKPPLHTWLSAIGMKIFGVGPFGARIMILATSVGVLGLVFSWVRQVKGIDHALIAVTVLFSSALFFGASAFVMTDMAMVLGTTLSMIGFYNCITNQPSGAMWGRLFFVGVAIGLLAKGPVALVLTLIPVIPWILLKARWRFLTRMPWRSGLMITALLALPWYIAAELKTPGFLQYFIIGEHYERFVVSGWQGDLYGTGHARPKGIIWVYWLATFLPWTFFVVALIPRAKMLWRDASQADRGWHSYLALWAISPLILFTPAANLLAAYVLPGLPAAAILLTSLWIKAWGQPNRATKGAVFMAVGGIAAVFFVITLIAQFSPETLNLKSEREVIAAAQSTAPDIQITYWGKRTYAAEFYTRGQVRRIETTADLAALTVNSTRDAVVLAKRDANEIQATLENNFTSIGEYGRRVVFVENTSKGHGQ